MKIKRLGGMASLLLLVSFLSPAKVTAHESEPNTPKSIDDRIADVHNKVAEAESHLLENAEASQKISDVIAQWGDWYDWGNWDDSWGDWNDWGDWVNWGDWSDWGDWYNY